MASILCADDSNRQSPIKLYALLIVGSSGSWYKSAGVFLKFVVINHKVKALAALFACVKRRTFNYSSLETGRNDSNPTALVG